MPTSDQETHRPRPSEDIIEEPAHLVDHCDVLQIAHTRSFVVGVFHALQRSNTVHPQDIQSAIDVCDEQPLEVDITYFLKTVCGHIRDFCVRSSRDSRSDSFATQSSLCGTQFPLNLLLSHQPCGDLRRVHAELKRKFAHILSASFGLAPACPDIYYYLPPEQRTALDDDDESLEDRYAEDPVPPADDETNHIQLTDLESTELWRQLQEQPKEDRATRTSRTSLVSNVDSESAGDLEERAVEVAEDGEEESMPPLFLQLTCSVRAGNDCSFSKHIRHIPTCIGELINELRVSEIPLDSLQVTLDILCLTLPYQVEVRISEQANHQVRATSFCSDGAASADLPEMASPTGGDSDSEQDSFSASQLGGQLGNLTEYQRQAVTATKGEIQWLLVDEVASLLLVAFPVQLSVLTIVADHVRRSAGRLQSSRPRRSCVHKQVPLNFVYGAEKSRLEFMERFRRLQVPGYKLAQLDNLYYLVQESSSCQPLTWHLVPPLEPLHKKTVYGVLPHQRPSTPDALMAQTLLARSTSVDLCQCAAGRDAQSDGDCTDHDNQKARCERRRLRRSVSHRPCSAAAEAPLSAEDREVAALFTDSRRQQGQPGVGVARSRSQGCQGKSELLVQLRRCRSAAEAREHSRTSEHSSALEDIANHTEDGYEGDGDNSDSEHENTDLESTRIILPGFWLILSVSEDLVDLFFHCRYKRENVFYDNKKVLDQVVVQINQICKLVNQMLLLQELETTRMCNNLLEPESSEDIWQRKDQLSPHGLISVSDHSPHYLEANMRFPPGYFSCPVVWSTVFSLHPRLRVAASVAVPGLAYLRQTLDTFAVTNRRNMFVFRDPALNQVHYLRLRDGCEPLPAQGHPSGESVTSLGDERSASFSHTLQVRHSVTSLPEDVYRARATSVGEREAQTRSLEDGGIVLMVHGITEPGTSIREDLVQLLRNRLDERLMELISMALLRNPQTKLAPEDVHFIQPPGAPPRHSLRYTVPASAAPHLSTVLQFLHNNLLQILHQPKYSDARLENHFRDFGGSDESDMFLYVPSEKHGTRGMACVGSRGMACVALSSVWLRSGGAQNPGAESGTTAGPQLQAPPSGPPAERDDGLDSASSLQTQERKTPVFLPEWQPSWTPDQFEMLTHTDLYSPGRDPDVQVVLQFNIWEKGRVNISWLQERLPSAIRNALWERCMEFYVLPHAPIHSQTGTPVRDLASVLRSPRSLALDDAAPPISTLSRILERRISSPLTLIQEGALSPLLGSGHSTPRHVSEPAGPPPLGTPLLPTYGSDLHRWLEFGSKLSVPSLRHNTLELSNRQMVGAFVRELEKLIREECPSLACHAFRPLSPGSAAAAGGGADDQGYVVCDMSEVGAVPGAGYIVVGYGRRVDDVRLVPHRLSFSGQMQTGANAIDGVDHPTSVPQSPNLTPIQPFRTPVELVLSPSSGQHPKQKLTWAYIQQKQVQLYCYNWPKEKWEHLQQRCLDLCQWTNARSSLLHSIVAQKLGLFHNQPFTRPADQHSNSKPPNVYENQMSHTSQLIRNTAPPPGSAVSSVGGGHRQQLGRTRLLTETLRDCKAVSLAAAADATNHGDALMRHGRQLVEVYKANRRDDEQKKLYHQCQNPESLDKEATVESFVRLIRGCGRLMHFCFTPLLFLPSWRWQTAVTRDQAADSCPEVSLSASGSGRGLRPPARHRHTSESTTGRPSPRLRRLAADERWHETLCTSLLGEFTQYLQTMGFMPLQYGRPGSTAAVRRTHIAEPASPVSYLHRVILGGGGYLLFEVGVQEPFFYVKLYALEGLRLRMRTRTLPVNLQNLQAFLTECDEIRAHIHLHSYMHDYHLRVMHQYVSGRPLLLRQGLHIVSFLEDFYFYYPKGPTHARNFMATGSLTIDDQSATSPDQLYNYLLTHEKRYRMRVLRMIPLFEDSGDDVSEDEYVLVRVSSRDMPPDQLYDLTLVVSRDLADPEAAMRLRLKLYVLLTSRRELYPTMFVERRFENYRRVDTAPGVLSDSLPGSPRYRVRGQTPAAGGDETPGTSSAGSGFFSSQSVLRPECVHYLGYFSVHEQQMQEALAEELARAHGEVEKLVGCAKVHCRRDLLWQRLREDEERSRGGALSCAEVSELLSLVDCQPLQELDPRLAPLVSQPLSWYSGLVRSLISRYPDSHRCYQTDQLRFLVILLPAELSTVLVLRVCAEPPSSANLWVVTRERQPPPAEPEPSPLATPPVPAPAEPDTQLLHQLIEEFVNCCCFQMWASFLQQ